MLVSQRQIRFSLLISRSISLKQQQQVQLGNVVYLFRAGAQQGSPVKQEGLRRGLDGWVQQLYTCTIYTHTERQKDRQEDKRSHRQIDSRAPLLNINKRGLARGLDGLLQQLYTCTLYTKTDRQTHNQTAGQTDRQADIQKAPLLKTGNQIDRKLERQIDRQADR